MKKLIGTLFVITILFTACAPSPETVAKRTAVAATSTAAAWTPTPVPTSTSTPKPTPKPFTSPVTSGSWLGDISIPLDLNKNESAQVELLISDDGKMIQIYQVYLTSCSMVIGDQNIPINQGVFSFSIDKSCDFTGTISISGVFVSETKLEGTIKAGSQTSYWEATPSK